MSNTLNQTVNPTATSTAATWQPQNLTAEELEECFNAWQIILEREKPDWCSSINLAAKMTPDGFRLSANLAESDKPTYDVFRSRTPGRQAEISQLNLQTLELATIESVSYILDPSKRREITSKWQISYKTNQDPRIAVRATMPQAQAAKRFIDIMENPNSTFRDIINALRSNPEADVPEASQLGMTEDQALAFTRQLWRDGKVDSKTSKKKQ